MTLFIVLPKRIHSKRISLRKTTGNLRTKDVLSLMTYEYVFVTLERKEHTAGPD